MRRMTRLACLLIGLSLVGGVPFGTGSAAAQPAPISGSPIGPGPGDQTWARVSGNLVVWQATQAPSDDDEDVGIPDADIFAHDLATGETRQLTTSHRAARPAVSGSVVVWTEVRGADRDIYGFDFATGQALTIVEAPGPQDFAEISGPLVIWIDGRERRPDLYGLSLFDGHEFPVAVGPGPRFHQRISGTTVVWQEGRFRPARPDIFALDLTTGQVRQITTSHLAAQPSIDGDWVVYAEGFSQAPAIMATNLRSGETRRLSAPSDGGRGLPTIKGNLVIWQDERDGDIDLWAYDLASGQEWALVDDPEDQSEPATDGVHLVWTDEQTDRAVVYLAPLPRP